MMPNFVSGGRSFHLCDVTMLYAAHGGGACLATYHGTLGAWPLPLSGGVREDLVGATG